MAPSVIAVVNSVPSVPTVNRHLMLFASLRMRPVLGKVTSPVRVPPVVGRKLPLDEPTKSNFPVVGLSLNPILGE